MELHDKFEEAKTIVEVFRLQSALKDSGEYSLEEINNAATARKKELSQNKVKFNTPLKKHKPAAVNTGKVTQYMIQPKHLNAGIIEFDGKSFII